MTRPLDPPTVLIIDDDPEFCRLAEWQLTRSDYYAMSAFDLDQAIGRIRERSPDVVLLDRHLGDLDGLELIPQVQAQAPGAAIVLVTASSTVDHAVQAIKLGAYDYLTKPLDEARLLTVLANACERGQLLRRLGPDQDDAAGPGFAGMIGASPMMQTVFASIRNVAPTPASVMIVGESGTGKELIARALHSQSNQRPGPLVPLNMATLPAELVESSLFGHEKGSFTGADRRRLGACEEAQDGTLFLDEITEMPIDLQPKLLRFLQERTFRRIGGDQDIMSNARIVSATNRDPLQAVRDGRLREDLYYRLNVVPIELPPLRERRGDVPLLAESILHRMNEEYSKGFDQIAPSALEAMSRCDWPGNVRQLVHTLERAVIMHAGPVLQAEMLTLPEAMPGETEPTAPSHEPRLVPEESHGWPAEDLLAPGLGSDQIVPLAELERRAILHALERCNQSATEAAKALGISPATIYRRLKQLKASA